MALHHVLDIRMEYTLPFITGRIYALIYIGNRELEQPCLCPSMTHIVVEVRDGYIHKS